MVADGRRTSLLKNLLKKLKTSQHRDTETQRKEGGSHKVFLRDWRCFIVISMDDKYRNMHKYYCLFAKKN